MAAQNNLNDIILDWAAIFRYLNHSFIQDQVSGEYNNKKEKNMLEHTKPHAETHTHSYYKQ